MMRGARIFVCAAAAGVAGCEAPMRLQPGTSGLIIHVRAEPKKGYLPPVPVGNANDPYAAPGAGAAPAESGRFQRIDYDALEDIVVWVQSHDRSAPAVTPPVVTINVPPRPPASVPVFA